MGGAWMVAGSIPVESIAGEVRPEIAKSESSAGVSKVGPCVPIYTPCCTLIPFSLAISSALSISLWSSFTHIRETGAVFNVLAVQRMFGKKLI